MNHSPAAWLHRHWAILLVLAVVAALYFPWSHNDALGLPFADAPNYLMMAQHYTLGGHTDPIYAQTASAARFPPLYPLTLAICGAAEDLLRAHALTTSFLLLGLLAVYAWLREVQIERALAALLVLTFAAVPGSWLAALSIQSEYLYLALSFGALALMASHLRNGRPQALYGAALLVCAAILARTVGISLLPPLALLVWRARWRTGLWAAALVLLPLLAWHFAHRTHLSYDHALLAVFGGPGWDGLWRQLAAELPALHHGYSHNFLHGMESWSPLFDAFGAIGLGAAAWRAARLQPDGLYVVVHLAILLVWPFPEEAARFLWVLLPLLLAQPLLLLSEWRAANRPAVAALLCAPALLLALPAIALAGERYRLAAYEDIPEVRGYVNWYQRDEGAARQSAEIYAVIVSSIQAIAEQVPANDCVIGVRPDLINFYGHRLAGDPPLNSVPDPEFGEMLRRSGCGYIFVASIRDAVYPNFFHPLPRLGTRPEIIYQSLLPGTGQPIAALIVNPTLQPPAR